MKCKVVHKNLIRYIEQTLPELLSTGIDKHIGSCLACKKLYDNLSATYTIFDQVSKPEITSFFYARIEQKLKSKVHPKTVLIPLFIRNLQPIAATILITVGISFGILMGKNLADSKLTKTDLNQNDAILEAYASEYYLNGTGEENLNNFLLINE